MLYAAPGGSSALDVSAVLVAVVVAFPATLAAVLSFWQSRAGRREATETKQIVRGNGKGNVVEIAERNEQQILELRVDVAQVRRDNARTTADLAEHFATHDRDRAHMWAKLAEHGIDRRGGAE